MTTATQSAIDAEEAQDLLASGQAMLIDVREPDEFRAAHIPFAASVPLAEVAQVLDDPALPRDRAIIFQCQKGARGEKACGIARAHLPGRPIHNLSGGIAAWEAADLAVLRDGAQPRVSLFRQVQMIVGMLVFASTVAGLEGAHLSFYLAALFGLMLAFAGLSGWCGLALLLARMPWNRPPA